MLRFFIIYTHRDFDHAIPPVVLLLGKGGRAGLELILPVGSDTPVGGLGCSHWGFLQISFSYILVYMFIVELIVNLE